METFYNYKSYRWLWINLGLLTGFSVAYLLDNPVGGRNGGTMLGYGLGIFAALGILYLMWYGIRKRSYHAKHTTLKGCLSAHVWLGITLLVIVPLHAGFSFGVNVHTLTYLLMVVVILSGVWGALKYVDSAPAIRSHRGGGTVKKLLAQIHLLSSDIEGLAKQKSDQYLKLLHTVDFKFTPSVTAGLCGKRPKLFDKEATAKLLANLVEKEYQDGIKLISLVNKKRDLACQVLEEVGTTTQLRIWLFLHLPLSFALLVALTIHIVSVLYFGSWPR